MFEPTARESRLETATIRIAIAVSFILTFLGLILVGYYYGVIRDSADKVRIADSDNVTWTIVQTEVDFQNLQLALSRALVSMQNGRSADIDGIKRAFDIYYSRTNAVQSVYGAAAGATNDGPGVVLERLNLKKIELAEVLDGWDEPSLADLTLLSELVDQSDDDVRSFTTQMLKVLVADASDARLGQLNILSRFAVLLALVVGLLFGMLAVSLLLLTRLQNKAITTSSIADNLRRIIEASQDAVIIANSHGTVLQYNRSAKEIFGYTPQEAIGVAMEDLFIPDDQKAAHRKGMARHAKTGQKTVVDQGRQVMTACDKSGREFAVEVTISESKDRLGKTIFIGILRDISARIAKDKELKAALEEAKKDASAKERFLAVMSHEMRTPLQGVLAAFDLLDTKTEDASAKSLINLGKQSGAKALEQVNKTLDLVQLNEGALFRQTDVIDPVASLQNLIRLLEPLLFQKSNTTSLETTSDPNLRLIGNQYLFDALFDNLLSNANKFTQDGHISVHLQATAVSGDNAELVIKVKDTGTGIAAEDYTAIFEDFKTSDDTYTRSFEGTGLGLGIVKRCCERMGGEITVTSQLGVGSIFSFRCLFKIAPDHIADTASHPTTNVDDEEEEFQPPKKAPFVLIVDDNKINYTMIGKMLEKLGCRFDYAEDGLSAVQKCIHQSYDLILMDLSMPVLNGIDSAPLLRQICRPQGSIVCISAHDSEEIRNSVREAGMIELLPKPIRLEALADLLKRTVMISADEELSVVGFELAGAKITDGEIAELFDTFGSEEMLSFIASFDGTLRGELAQVKTQLNTGDHKGAAAILHGSAGSAKMIGAGRLSALLVLLEDLATTGKLKSNEALLNTCTELSATFMKRANALAGSMNENKR